MSRGRIERGDEAGRPLPPRLDPRAGRPPRHHATGNGSPPAQRPRRHRGIVLARVVGAVLSAALLATSGWGWYLARVAEASVSRTDAIPTTGNSDVNGKNHAGQEMNLLLVGMDSRKGLTPEQQAEYATGDPDGLLNTDTMMLVHIPADGSAASFVSFPRDIYASIPGHGKGKLNSAYAFGYNGTDGTDAQKDAAGAQLLIQTISQLSGLQIDHFAEVNLLGFINLSNIVGAVQVNLCQAAHDPVTGASFPAGVQKLSGSQALLFVRQRHGLGSDLDRVVRQQVYIAGMLRNLLSSHLLLDLSKQRAIVEQVGSSVTLDQGLNVFDLASQMQTVQPGNITFQTIPGLTDGNADGWGSVLKLPSQQVLNDFFASLTADPAEQQSTTPAAPQTVAPERVTVAVYNGTGTSGLAAQTATGLESAGFVVASRENADSNDYTKTEIRYAAGDDALASTLAASIPGATLKQVGDATKGTVQLVLGSDFNGIGKAVTVASSAASSSGYATNERTATDTSCIN